MEGQYLWYISVTWGTLVNLLVVGVFGIMVYPQNYSSI